jgi:hypothetical protein
VRDNGTAKKRSKVDEKNKMIENEYGEVPNESSAMNNSNSHNNDTNDEMIQMHEISGGLLLPGKIENSKKLPPSTSKLYKEDAKNNMPPEESKGSSGDNSDLLDSKNGIKKSDEDESKSTKTAESDKTTETEKEYEELRKQEDSKKEEVIIHYLYIIEQLFL